MKWLRPDGKAQVTVRYDDTGKPVAVEKLVLAVAHNEADDAPSKSELTSIKSIVKPVLKHYKFDLPADENIIINGTGLWHIPGPESDAGLTGRKIVVDTYGGYARVGGGAFSGKDPSKVDRSGAYAARYIAKNIVNCWSSRQMRSRSGLCHRPARAADANHRHLWHGQGQRRRTPRFQR